jgi:hypothetical protein
MASYVDPRYFQDLAKADPAFICRANRCRHAPATGCYTVTIWDAEYVVDCKNHKIARSGESGPLTHEYFYLFIIYYLLLPESIPHQGEWISEKDLPGGPTFFRGPHLLPTELISSRFANDLQGFSTCCQQLGGKPLALADAAFSFRITDDIPLAVLYWTGDEDFPAEAKILYDRGIINKLPLDIVFALAVEICSRLAGPALIAEPL